MSAWKRATMSPWQHAVDDALVGCGLDCTSLTESPREAVERLVAHRIQIATDPAVSDLAPRPAIAIELDGRVLWVTRKPRITMSFAGATAMLPLYRCAVGDGICFIRTSAIDAFRDWFHSEWRARLVHSSGPNRP